MHVRVGELQVGLRDVQVIVEQQVDVDGAVGIMAANALMLSAELALYGLCGEQAVVRRERGHDLDAAIQELIWGREAPGLGLQKMRTRHHAADPQADERDGAFHSLVSLAQIGAETEIECMQTSR